MHQKDLKEQIDSKNDQYVSISNFFVKVQIASS